MAEQVALSTNRGKYFLKVAGEPQFGAGEIVLPVVLEHQDGLERIGLVCRIEEQASSLGGMGKTPELAYIMSQLGERISRDFEQVREAALKSIRTEKKLYEFVVAL